MSVTENLHVTSQLNEQDELWNKKFCEGYDNLPKGPLREIDYKQVYKLRPSEQAQLFGEWLRRVAPDYFENPMPLESIRYIATKDRETDPYLFDFCAGTVEEWLTKMETPHE